MPLNNVWKLITILPKKLAAADANRIANAPDEATARALNPTDWHPVPY
jgi:hypothetical protein